ncbi:MULTISPECIES: hypothetical protein [Heyndrickxia]|uniref:Uncharacterized protein n=1 Tax=Heyndrickxia sporothermodurans TaxID=46224 RepID=A0A150L3N2_9BACI|nr:hypothetical protein [Heyndrickxia sporothermodurans]KYD06925.1 hypothetical protein B4102_3008 [Heyndrickxia sporothermodurans]MED3651608.1 hypothetical protein [Heyndrickxia sporothermodurans]MED3655002.1 hypothetical protein [Heyndrickxia sporothermodurans]MED3699763.1 hypothetical protein [Heyndrickxia sporothermodurans]MED3778966.1 hypothetical protein [Heyndrickxia sporothermodurans]
MKKQNGKIPVLPNYQLGQNQVNSKGAGTLVKKGGCGCGKKKKK